MLYACCTHLAKRTSTIHGSSCVLRLRCTAAEQAVSVG